MYFTSQWCICDIVLSCSFSLLLLYMFSFSLPLFRSCPPATCFSLARKYPPALLITCFLAILLPCYLLCCSVALFLYYLSVALLPSFFLFSCSLSPSMLSFYLALMLSCCLAVLLPCSLAVLLSCPLLLLLFALKLPHCSITSFPFITTLVFCSYVPLIHYYNISILLLI